MKKPLIKDALDYFRKDENWTPIWSDGQTSLNIEKLNGACCLRLGIIDHDINEYVHKDYDPLLYFVGAKRIGDIHKVYERSDLSNEEIKNIIRYHWEDNE